MPIFSPVSQSASCPETLSHFSDLTVALRKHERQLNSIEEQQKKMLMTVRRETKLMEGQRQSLIKQLEMVRIYRFKTLFEVKELYFICWASRQ